jgi:hypothetical protein
LVIEPVACTPASGWEKGQVENQVGNLRDQMFRPKPRVKSFTELNAWLADQCIAYARRTKHPEFKDRTIWEVFQDERPGLMELRGPFDGFVEKAVRASTTCLIMADHNRYRWFSSTMRWWPTTLASSGASRSSTILGIICRF